MVAPRVIGKIELPVIVLVTLAAIGGHWADATELSSAVRQPESEAIVTETMGEYYEQSAPVWYFGVDALALRRDGVNRAFASLVTRNWTETTSTTGDPPVTTSTWTKNQTAVSVLDFHDVDDGYRGGWNAMIGRTFGERGAMEVSYFGLSDWSDTRTVTDNTPFQLEDPDTNPGVGASLFSPFTDLGGDPVEGLDYNYLTSISYSSSLYGLEWNLRRQLIIPAYWVQGSVLIGGRYMDLREGFSYYSESAYPAAATNSVTTHTENKMTGVQVGAEFNFQVEPQCWVDCEIKGGIFNNAASQNTTFVHVGVPAYEDIPPDNYRAENTSTFALDLSLHLTYECNSFTTLRIGYQALWIDGLALASDNAANVLVLGPAGPVNPPNRANLVNNGKAVYHGPRLGITCAW
jgi:putative beta barrel porin BBP7